jgi:hypothetical protein
VIAKEPSVSGRIEGQIVAASPDGDLISDITVERLRGVPHDQSVRICCDEHETIGIFTADHQEPESTFLAMLHNGSLQLRIVGMSARDMLGIRIGEKVVVEW